MLEIFCMVSIFFVLESLFCFIAKKHEIISKRHEEEGGDMSTSPCVLKKLVSIIYAIVLDLTFLMGKIIGYFPSHAIRMLFYRYIFHMKIGENCVIHYGLELRSPWNIEIGTGTIIGDHAILDGRYGITIGENVNFSTGVWIWTLQHDVNDSNFGIEGQGASVTVGNRAWISCRTVILPGCKILEGDVIAAGAVLTSNCDEKYAIYGGIPAKKIGIRNHELSYKFDGKHRFFL